MLKVLVPVDGSKTAERAVKHVIELAKGHESMQIHLVNVQQEADAWEVRRLLKPNEIKRLQLDHGAEALRTASALLDRAGLGYKTHVLIGDPAGKIVQFSKRNGIGKIVMGTHGRGSMVGLLMGSVASKVLHLATVPVTLVK